MNVIYRERIDSLYDEIVKLKRSNAALKGVITKLKNKMKYTIECEDEYYRGWNDGYEYGMKDENNQ